jgi:hypothetical protein
LQRVPARKPRLEQRANGNAGASPNGTESGRLMQSRFARNAREIRAPAKPRVAAYEIEVANEVMRSIMLA